VLGETLMGPSGLEKAGGVGMGRAAHE
jgi:hypothetical protein